MIGSVVRGFSKIVSGGLTPITVAERELMGSEVNGRVVEAVLGKSFAKNRRERDKDEEDDGRR